jgi:hypothetical protein
VESDDIRPLDGVQHKKDENGAQSDAASRDRRHALAAIGGYAVPKLLIGRDLDRVQAGAESFHEAGAGFWVRQAGEELLGRAEGFVLGGACPAIVQMPSYLKHLDAGQLTIHIG